MSKRSKQKISTHGCNHTLDNNPFDSLDIDGLPKGTISPEKPTNQSLLAPKHKGRVEVRREKAGRGGKTVTTLREFSTNVPLKQLETMTFTLKKTCACGGTLKGRSIELQGDVCDRVMTELQKLGYKPVRAGG
jgi:translation initiation factor 1